MRWTVRSSLREKGVVMFTFLLTFLMVLPLAGLAFDCTVLFLVRAKLSAAVDAAALAGARSLNRGMDLPSQQEGATTTAVSFFNANFPEGSFGTRHRNLEVNIAESGYRTRTVELSASVEAPLYFLGILGHNSGTVRARGVASRRDLNLVMVLDRSVSMQSGGVCETMKAAALDFANRFSAGRDRLGLVTFGGSHLVAYPPSYNFKSDSPSLIDYIGQISCGGNTGTAQGLWQGYQQLVNLDEAGALNVLLLFTDGLPNGVTAEYPVKTSGACGNKSPKLGFIAQWANGQPTGDTAGVLNHVAASVSDHNEKAVPGCDGCAFGPPGSTKNVKKMKQEVESIPAVDYYGNPTTGYKPVNLSRVDLPPQIIAASLNAADNAAERIRQDTRLGVFVFTIGLGGTSLESPDHDFMRRISNVPDSPIFNPDSPQGLYVYSPNPAQLASAFAKVASEVLRLAE